MVFKNTTISGCCGMASCTGHRTDKNSWAYSCLAYSSAGKADVTTFTIPLWLIFLCSAVMGLGTSIGMRTGRNRSGWIWSTLRHTRGFSADAVGPEPVDRELPWDPGKHDSHEDNGYNGRRSCQEVDVGQLGRRKEMLTAWILTFPGCGLIGFLMASLFMKIF